MLFVCHIYLAEESWKLEISAKGGGNEVAEVPNWLIKILVDHIFGCFPFWTCCSDGIALLSFAVKQMISWGDPWRVFIRCLYNPWVYFVVVKRFRVYILPFLFRVLFWWLVVCMMLNILKTICFLKIILPSSYQSSHLFNGFFFLSPIFPHLPLFWLLSVSHRFSPQIHSKLSREVLWSCTPRVSKLENLRWVKYLWHYKNVCLSFFFFKHKAKYGLRMWNQAKQLQKISAHNILWWVVGNIQ